ncbi:hypothetical protein C0068_10645 [Zhongshania marina]|uniref:Uncharacterized protein n=1 Tax=Zhongshania marina TaxID=2304603 RepID=A0A2S4HFB2_9GAMM|nr:hypothetical protein C0068_10645 [Marortus luteolus]
MIGTDRDNHGQQTERNSIGLGAASYKRKEMAWAGRPLQNHRTITRRSGLLTAISGCVGAHFTLADRDCRERKTERNSSASARPPTNEKR